HPVTQDYNQLIIEAGLGLGEAIVSGSITPDSYVVEKQPRRIIDKNVEIQTRGLFRSKKGGNEWRDISKEQGEKQVLSDKQILDLSELILKIENHYGFPCDIEWALEKGKFYIVQSRPITTLNEKKDYIHKNLVSLGKRDTDLFTAKLRIRGWTEFLEKEIGVSYKTIIINSDGEMFINPEEDDNIRNKLQDKQASDAFEYIDKIYKLKDNLLAKPKKHVGEEILSVISKMFSYFLIAKTIVEEVYESSTDKDKKKFDVWRNDDPISDVINVFTGTSNKNEWSLIFDNGTLNILKEKVSYSNKTEYLHPTVKRDLSLFSVQAWQKGYTHYLKESLGWWYDIIFNYDGNKVNFYHTQSDFDHFKNVITQQLIKDDKLFAKLNKDFQDNVKRLKKLKVSEEHILQIFNLIGRIMSLYIFIVSDSFVKARPEGWESRHMSKDILYNIDRDVEVWLGKLLKKVKIDPKLAHYLTLNEIEGLLKNKPLDIEAIEDRRKGYIIFNDEFNTKDNFLDFCKKHNWVDPETEVKIDTDKIIGNVAFPGQARGVVKVVRKREDFSKVKNGDVLVAVMTNANFLPILKKASAFITDEGGITCHAAIVARELKKPCIIGTKIATQVLKDGDLVEVDADKGIVKIIK
ncbi:MAG: PEP/pyruvate-binding domain-containing protein, partial [Candidatus Taylorbacteria bacterium]|nr:PEP/pyruvate-binding domain-containing protein [Candidatus Taylorbacteria bacterium]